MKKLFYFLAVVITVNVFAQSPEEISFQAVIRDNAGALAINKNVEVTVRIFEITEEVYQETHTGLQTNANGLLSLNIGSGVSVYGIFGSLAWEKGSYSIETETTVDGQLVTSSFELQSVPYAFYATDAATVTGHTLEKDVPEDAVFTDAQTAAEVSLEIESLSATNVQEALIELSEAVNTSGDMKKMDYDINADGIADNAARVNNLSVETSVPENAVFTDSQKGTEVNLTTPINMEGDSVTTVEQFIIKLNEELIRLQVQLGN